MAYGAFREVTGVIAEREWCVSSGSIGTTGVSSCIIVVSTVGSKLFGVHLSIVGIDSAFGPDDAKEVGAIMKRCGADTNNVHIFGEVDFWGSAIPGYDTLMAVLNQPGPSRFHQKSGNITISKSDVA
jgi:hypothetical protein